MKTAAQMQSFCRHVSQSLEEAATRAPLLGKPTPQYSQEGGSTQCSRFSGQVKD